MLLNSKSARSKIEAKLKCGSIREKELKDIFIEEAKSYLENPLNDFWLIEGKALIQRNKITSDDVKYLDDNSLEVELNKFFSANKHDAFKFINSEFDSIVL